MGTFHSLCARVLRRDGAAIGIDPRFAIYDTDDQTATMKLVLRELELAGTSELRPSALLGADRPLEERPDRTRRLRRTAARGYLRGDLRPGLRRATRRDCGEPDALDFDDLLNEAVRLFERRPRC